jgi:hypothetical protein
VDRANQAAASQPNQGQATVEQGQTEQGQATVKAHAKRDRLRLSVEEGQARLKPGEKEAGKAETKTPATFAGAGVSKQKLGKL